jgi:hypothetical protein
MTPEPTKIEKQLHKKLDKYYYKYQNKLNSKSLNKHMIEIIQTKLDLSDIKSWKYLANWYKLKYEKTNHEI